MHKLITILCLSLTLTTEAQTAYGTEPFAHTFSIVARDKVTGEMGVAVQSHWFSVGTLVSWGEAGVGVIATQSFVNPSFGPKGLEMLRAGLTAQQALDVLISNDEQRAVRQLAILDAKGNVAVYTGSNCIQSAGHQKGDNYAVEANLMRNDKVWPAMAMAFESAQGSLAERMLAALDAGQEAGGDIRGKQSAAILVVAPKSTNQPWVDRRIDLQIADNPEPLKELRRLLLVQKAYDYMNRGDLAIELGDTRAAEVAYGNAEAILPDNEEMRFWHAVALANNGKISDAAVLFKSVYAKNPDYKDIVNRIIQVGLLRLNQVDLAKILPSN